MTDDTTRSANDSGPHPEHSVPAQPLPAPDAATGPLPEPVPAARPQPDAPVPEFPVSAPPAGTGPAEPAVEDRVWIHFAWEGVLLVLLAGGIALWWAAGRDTGLLEDPDLLGDRLYAVAPLLLLATALAVSVRVRAANLAVGAVAGLAALLFVKWEDDHQLVAAGLVVAMVLAVTAALVVLVGVLRIPGWAASLGTAVAVLATAVTVAADSGLELLPSAGGLLRSAPESSTVTVGNELVWVVVGAVLAVSVLGGAAGLLPAARRRLQACREVATGPDRWELPQAVPVGAALLGSNLLAAGAGVLLVIPSERVAGGELVPADAFGVAGLALALAIVLLGGTSMWGKRGGAAGTALAGLALFAVSAAFADLDWLADHGAWIVVGALGLGFVVSWLVELLGVRKPRPTQPPLASIEALAEPDGDPPAPGEAELDPDRSPAGAGSEAIPATR